MQLNPDQQEVVNSHDGVIALLAGPGAGKTATLIARYKAILESGISPQEIVGITFTKEAAEEMKKRAGKGNFRTFHSFGYDVISREKGRPPMEPELRHRLLYKLVKKYRLDYKELAAYISKQRFGGVTPEQAMEEGWYGLPQAYRDYEQERKVAGWIDFDSMLMDSLALLENPEVRARHQYRYVMVDEFQDTDLVQVRLLQYITEKHQNVMVVGDAAQSIYAFRGAKPEVLLNFDTYFPKARFMYLGTNYRSTKTITDFVRENYPIQTPLKEKLLPARTESGEEIEYRAFYSEQDEAESAIAAAHKDPLQSAILARTNRGLATAENFCLENNIKYHLLGKSGFWKQNEVRKAVEKLKPYGHLKMDTAANIVLPDLERSYQVDDATQEDNDALENLRALRTISRKFSTCADFVAFANRACHAKKQKGIILSTVHQAKGCEWANVFVIGARADMIPHIKGDPAEEARIWFVAISRAKDRLRISWVGIVSVYLRRWLTPEKLLELQEQAGNVERLKSQQELFV